MKEYINTEKKFSFFFFFIFPLNQKRRKEDNIFFFSFLRVVLNPNNSIIKAIDK